MTTAFIGQPVSRVDGRQKVTGGATYAAEFDVPGQAHGAIVRSTVANGRIASIDSAAAERAPGVVAVLTHRNAPRLAYRAHKGFVDPDVGERLHVLQDDRVSHQGQPIALVIADTLEQANHAADAGARHLRGRNRDHRHHAASSRFCRPSRRPTRASAGRRRRGAAIPKERSRPPRSRSTRPT